jgi:hypothetical protein
MLIAMAGAFRQRQIASKRSMKRCADFRNRLTRGRTGQLPKNEQRRNDIGANWASRRSECACKDRIAPAREETS